MVCNACLLSFCQANTIQQGRGIGGFKPLNTLHNDPHNKPNPVSKSQPLWFESHRNHERRSDTHPPKRQRTEEGSTSRYHTHKKVIDLETPSSQTKGTPSARSTHSQSVQWSNRLPEYKAAEMNVKQLKVRRKLSGSVIRQTSKSAGHPQRPKLESSNRAVIDHGRLTNGGHREDPDDPISDSEPPVLKPSPKTHIEVVIPPLPSPNRGDAKLHPARDSESRDRGSTTTARKKTATTSHYFPAEGIDRKELDSLLSDSVVEVAESDLVATARPNGVSTKKQGVSHSSKGRGAPGASEDELAMDSNPPPKANGLILKRKQVTGLPSKAKKREHPPDSGSDASEDHLRNSSISDTKLRKKKKQYKVLGDSRFDVLQFFTQRQSWLHAHEQPWSLQQDHTTGILTFFDHGGYLVEDMQLESKRFHQISHNAENGKLHINKSADHEARGAHQIFLELAGAEQSREFCNNASLLSRSITILNKTNLDKIFAKTQAGLLTHKINDNDEPEDIKLAKRNHEAKVGSAFDVAQQVKQEASRTSSQIGQDAESPARRNRSFLRALSPCPSDDAFGLEPIELSRPTKLASMDDGNLHLTRSKNRSRELAPRQLAKIRSPSPERWTEINSAWARDYNWQSSVIFPKDGRKKATVDKQDIERLDEGQFLNDNLIMFWLLKLEQDLTDRDPELATRVYFHNTFFYERLTQPFKGKKGINYEAVERWTSKVDLFSYDYIIVPVNEHSHWYLAVIYNAPKLLKPKPNVDSSQSQDAESVQLSTDIAEKSSPLPLELSPSKMINIMPQEDQPKSSKEGSEPKRTSSTERVQNHPDVSDDLPESDHQPIHDRVTQEAAAIAKPPKPATPVKRGRKKSFTPAPRKFSPKEPKIITLDSLGMSHSATCTNLRDYLVAEGKAKRNVDIDPPRALGMTALNIPQQKNYCDCGLYLLSYVEALLENPDGFTENLLAKLDMEIEHRFEKASQMRIRIRELLLELQKLQVAKKAGKDHKTGKGGSNKVFPKAEEACPIPSESRMREESNSARSSADPDCPKSRKSFEPPDSAENGTAPSVLRSSSHTATPPRHTRLRPESPPKSSFFAQSDQTGDAVEHLDESRRPEYHEKGGEQQKNSGPLLATTSLLQEVMTTVEEEPCDSFHNHNLNKQPRSTGASLPSAMNPVSSHDTGSKNLNLLQPGTSLANALEVEDDSPQKDPCIIRRVLSPDNSVTPPQRDLVSPSPDVVPTVVSVRGRASTPYPQDMASVSSGFDETQVEDGNVLLSSLIDSSNLESPPLEPAARGPLPIPASNFVDMTGDDSQVADDEVMLLDIGSAPVPAFLGDSSSPAPSSPSTEKQIVTSRNTSNHKQDKPTKRSKNIVIGGQGRPKFMERDSSDKAVIGRVKFAGGQKRFSE